MKNTINQNIFSGFPLKRVTIKYAAFQLLKAQTQHE